MCFGQCSSDRSTISMDPPAVRDTDTKLRFTTTLEAMAAQPSWSLRKVFKPQPPLRPGLSRKFAGTAKINLNKYWHVLEDLVHVETTYPTRIPRTIRENPRDYSDVGMANEINENLVNERYEILNASPTRSSEPQNPGSTDPPLTTMDYTMRSTDSSVLRPLESSASRPVQFTVYKPTEPTVSRLAQNLVSRSVQLTVHKCTESTIPRSSEPSVNMNLPFTIFTESTSSGPSVSRGLPVTIHTESKVSIMPTQPAYAPFTIHRSTESAGSMDVEVSPPRLAVDQRERGSTKKSKLLTPKAARSPLSVINGNHRRSNTPAKPSLVSRSTPASSSPKSPMTVLADNLQRRLYPRI